MATGVSAAKGSGTAEGAPDSAAVRVVLDNSQALRITDLGLRYIDEDPGALTAGSQQWVAEVAVAWSLAGAEQGESRSRISFTFALEGARAVIVGIGGHQRRTPLWLTEPVTVARASGVVVMAAAAHESSREFTLARRARRAVRDVLADWHGSLVVEVPATTTQLAAALEADPASYDGIAAVTATVDGSLRRRAPVHVYLNPAVFATLTGRGAQVVMTHEATHVATGAATSSMPLWLVEGFADYVALRRLQLPLAVTAAQIRSQVQERGLPRTLPDDADFDTGTAHLGAAYEAAWLACVTLADLEGTKSLLRYYEAVQAGGSQVAEVQKVFGITHGALIRRWRGRLQHLAE